MLNCNLIDVEQLFTSLFFVTYISESINGDPIYTLWASKRTLIQLEALQTIIKGNRETI